MFFAKSLNSDLSLRGVMLSTLFNLEKYILKFCMQNTFPETTLGFDLKFYTCIQDHTIRLYAKTHCSDFSFRGVTNSF